MATTVRRDTVVSSPAQDDAEQELLSFTPISSLEAVGIQRGAASLHAHPGPRELNLSPIEKEPGAKPACRPC